MMKYIVILAILSPYIGLKAQDQNNLQTYTPSVLLQPLQWEYKFFNNLYTQTKSFDSEGTRTDHESRATYFSSINQFLYGVTPHINIGAEFWVKSVRTGPENESAFKVLAFQNDSNTRTALSGIGPKIKFAPFQKIEKLSLQTTILFPVAKDMEGIKNGKPYLSEDSYIWYTQIFYDQPIGTKFQLFFQVTPWINIKKEKQEDGLSRFSYANPVGLFFSYFATPRFTFYLQNEYWPSFGSEGISSWFLQQGGGLKIQVIPGFLETELLYTNFTLGKNTGAGQTFNLGLRFIR